jgi:2-polyprenyl-3-methyl-5-hydroxy-6-metoxy-1,4-benzoquinol methylase
MDDKNEYTYSSKFIKRTDRVLEVGSGKGAFRKHIDALEYIGLEFNRKAIEEGAKEGIQILQQSIQSFATSHQYQYDVVCAFQVLEHIAEISSFIKACCSCLKPGGFLIYSVPSANSFAKYVPNFVLDMPPHHVTKWSDQALKSLARCMQLELIEIWHEPLQPIHKSFYAETIFINAAFKLLKLKRKNIDHRVLTKAIFLFARQLGKIFAHGLTDHEILPKGISVTTVYQKPLIGF